VKITLAFALALFSFTSHAALLSITPDRPVVNVGENVSFSISGSAFADILGGGFDLKYDPAAPQLAPAGISLADPPWDGAFNRTEKIDAAAGTVSDFSFNQFNGVSGSPQIATFTFKAIGVGITQPVLSGSARFPFSNNDGRVDVDFGTGSVVVVPEPAAWWLFSVGLVLLLSGKWRRGSPR